MLSIFGLAIIIRLYWLVVRGGLEQDQTAWAIAHYYGFITRSYIQMRDAILAGDWAHMAIDYPPGYPVFLSVLHLLGMHDLRIVRIAQTFLDAAAILPIYYIVRRLTRSAPLAACACCLYATAPWWAVGSSYLLAESLLPLLVVLLLAAMLWVRDHAASKLNWAALGLLGVVLPFFRPEMTLLIGPLVLWALLVAPPKQRTRSAATVALSFAAPLIGWALRNYALHGYFALTPSVTWYALWSGLGQLPNHFGYVLSDVHAQQTLASMNIEWHTPQAETYWRGQYIAAWHAHPIYVMRTILYRLHMILFTPDTIFGFSAIGNFVFKWLPWLTLLALFGLLWKRRWPDAMLVAGPMAYALLTLGLMYVEARYVRYASLTYLLAFPVLLSLMDNAFNFDRNVLKLGLRSNLAKPAVGILGTALVFSYALFELPGIRTQAEQETLRSSVDQKAMTALAPSRVLDEIKFKKAVTNVTTIATPSGLKIDSPSAKFNYLLYTPFSENRTSVVGISYKIRLEAGGLYIGILSADGRRWLSLSVVTGDPGSTKAGSFTSFVQPDSNLVIGAQTPSGGETRAVIEALSGTFTCPEHRPSPLRVLFTRRLPKQIASACRGTISSYQPSGS